MPRIVVVGGICPSCKGEFDLGKLPCTQIK
jgi:hypothetical protein